MFLTLEKEDLGLGPVAWLALIARVSQSRTIMRNCLYWALGMTVGYCLDYIN